MGRTKRVEFRRRGFRRQVSHVVIYSTSPDKRLVGLCDAEVVMGTPEFFWQEYGDIAGISKDELFAYLDGLSEGVAIILKKIYSLRAEIGLWDIGVVRPPQSFQYITNDAFARIKANSISV